jgi:ABC-2 type transport system permease protein
VQLIIGKFLGLGGLALTQVAFWAMTAAFIANLTGQLDVLANVRLEFAEIIVMALYFLLTFGLYAGIMIAIGSAVSAEQESRQVAAIFTLIFVSPSWAIGAFFEAPTGPITTAFGLFPMTSGLSNLVLIGLGETRTWQIVLSLGLLFATTVFMLFAAAKIFRAGALLYGQRLSFGQLRRALRG